MNSEKIDGLIGPLAYEISLVDLNHGLIPFFRNFGNIWIGYLHPKVFVNQLKNCQQETFRRLLQSNLMESDPDQLATLSNRLDMCRRALKESWRWPIMATAMRTGWLYWNNGQNRLFAAGLCWDEPWRNYRALILSECDSHIPNYMTEYQKINSDSELLECLGLKGTNAQAKLTARILSVGIDRKELTITIDNISDFEKFQIGDRKSAIQDFVSWRDSQPPSPRLVVYTNWPDSITDSSGFWDLEILGPTPDDFDMDSFHRSLTNAHGHVLIVKSPRSIDVGQLLIWMDNIHTVWVDRRGDVLLMKASDQIQQQIIGICSH